MFLRNDRVYYSATDLKGAVECEWALMRKLDSKLGRIEAVEEVDDPMLVRAGKLGNEHEARALDDYKLKYGDGVVEIDTHDARADPAILRQARDETVDTRTRHRRMAMTRPVLHTAASARGIHDRIRP